jgi:hypothetical protein
VLTSRRYNLNKIPVNFMESELCAMAIRDLIVQIEVCREIQSSIDNIYTKLCDVIFAEMDRNIPKYKSSRGRPRNKKHYWNDRLSNLWLDMNEKERLFLKPCATRTMKEARRRDYILVRNLFETNRAKL